MSSGMYMWYKCIISFWIQDWPMPTYGFFYVSSDWHMSLGMYIWYRWIIPFWILDQRVPGTRQSTYHGTRQMRNWDRVPTINRCFSKSTYGLVVFLKKYFWIGHLHTWSYDWHVCTCGTHVLFLFGSKIGLCLYMDFWCKF